MSPSIYHVRWNPEKDLLSQARLEAVGSYSDHIRGLRATRLVYSILQLGGASTGAIVCQDFNNFLLHDRGEDIERNLHELATPNAGVVFPTLARLCGMGFVSSGDITLASGEVHFYQTTSVKPKGPLKHHLPNILRPLKPAHVHL
jgi:hypothetical protein